MFRFLLALIAVIPATIYHGGRMIWVVARKSPNAACVCDDAPRQWATLLLWLSGVKIEFENLEAIDPDRPQILVANHNSWFDVLAVSRIPGRYLFVAKKELSRVPIFGTAVGGCGHIFIDRKDRNRAFDALTVARQRLEDESPTIIMFPEGTRSDDGQLQPFKKGAFVLALQAGVDVIPAAIYGSRDVMRKGSMLIRPGTIRIRFGEPISVQDLEVAHRNELTERAHQELSKLLAQDAIPSE